MNSKEFSLTIEGIVKEKKISHMDAVIWYCEENSLDPSQVSSLISKSLKEKIQLEAFGGLSLRWNRQYIRFTGDLQEQPERESNLWLDLRLAWTPWAER